MRATYAAPVPSDDWPCAAKNQRARLSDRNIASAALIGGKYGPQSNPPANGESRPVGGSRLLAYRPRNAMEGSFAVCCNGRGPEVGGRVRPTAYALISAPVAQPGGRSPCMHSNICPQNLQKAPVQGITAVDYAR